MPNSESGFQYVTSMNRYRDKNTGQFVAEAVVRGYIEQLAGAGGSAGDRLAEQVADQTLTPAEWEAGMRAELKATTIQQYLLGRGGRDEMAFRDWGSIGRMLRLQYNDLKGFRADLETQSRSAAYISNRSNLYFLRTREAYERGQARAYGLPQLPAYPCDLTSDCMAGDKCRWRFVKLRGAQNYDCFWEIDSPKESCPTCVERAQQWAPLQVRDGELQPYTEIRAEAHNHQNTHEIAEP